MPSPNKVTKKECIEAIEYFHVAGYIENLSGDAEFYLKPLLKKVANNYNLYLKGL
tara:strand:- start:2457 stop:2621 length:165 start_codon:yes stop_codon:yes gene_type:complete